MGKRGNRFVERKRSSRSGSRFRARPGSVGGSICLGGDSARGPRPGIQPSGCGHPMWPMNPGLSHTRKSRAPGRPRLCGRALPRFSTLLRTKGPNRVLTQPTERRRSAARTWGKTARFHRRTELPARPGARRARACRRPSKAARGTTTDPSPDGPSGRSVSSVS